MSTTELELHEVSKIFPAMNEQEYRTLKDHIHQNGQLESIWIYRGQIIDGRHRYRACLELGIEPQCREWTGEGSLVDFSLGMNLTRRNLNESQRAMAAAAALPFYEDEAKQRQQAAGRNHGRGKDSADLRAPIGETRKASEDVAQVFKVSPRTVESAKSIRANGIPELVEGVSTGRIKVSTAAMLATASEEKQREILASGDPKEISQAAKELRDLKKTSTGKKQVLTTDGADTRSSDEDSPIVEGAETDVASRLKLLLEKQCCSLQDFAEGLVALSQTATDSDNASETSELLRDLPLMQEQINELHRDVNSMLERLGQRDSVAFEAVTSSKEVHDEVEVMEPMSSERESTDGSLTESSGVVDLEASIMTKLKLFFPGKEIDIPRCYQQIKKVPADIRKFSPEEKNFMKERASRPCTSEND